MLSTRIDCTTWWMKTISATMQQRIRTKATVTAKLGTKDFVGADRPHHRQAVDEGEDEDADDDLRPAAAQELPGSRGEYCELASCRTTMAMEKTSVATVSEVVATVWTKSRAPTAPPVERKKLSWLGMVKPTSISAWAAPRARSASVTGNTQTALAKDSFSRARSVLAAAA